MRRFGLYAALTLCVFGIPATAASERFEQWSLEQPGDFIFALSFKRSIFLASKVRLKSVASTDAAGNSRRAPTDVISQTRPPNHRTSVGKRSSFGRVALKSLFSGLARPSSRP